eukprot:744097-Prymnesium_polylepis.1
MARARSTSTSFCTPSAASPRITGRPLRPHSWRQPSPARGAQREADKRGADSAETGPATTCTMRHASCGDSHCMPCSHGYRTHVYRPACAALPVSIVLRIDL